MIRIGFIGCGKQANIHLQVIRELQDKFEIVALCDINNETLESFWKSIGSPKDVLKTNDYKECIDFEKIDAVVISTHTYQHLEHASYAIEKNKHALVEKPLGINIKDVDQLVQRALKSDVVVYPGLHYRHSNFFSNLVSYKNSDWLDGTKYITISEHRNNFFLPWFYDKNKSGGAINDKLIHYFDLINCLFSPSKPLRVFASGFQHKFSENFEIEGIFGEKFELNSTIVDNAQIIIQYEDEKTANVNLNMYQKTPVEGLQIYVAGLNGNFCRVINADTPDCKIITHDEDDSISEFSIIDQLDSDSFGIGHPGTKTLFIDFYKSIKQNKKARVNPWTARMGQIIAFAAEESAVSSEVVNLSKFENKSLQDMSQKRNWDFDFDYKEFELKKVDYTQVAKPKKRMFLRRIIPRFGKPKTHKNLTLRILKQIISEINNESTNSEGLIGIDIKFILDFPWRKFEISVKNQEIRVKKAIKIDENDPVIRLTQKGWNGFLEGKSINYLYFTRNLTIKGDMNSLRQMRVYMNIINEKVRDKCK